MDNRSDIQLIEDTLAGNDTAFGVLVRKYQKSVHAFVWSKTQDFHYAEEITQDVFIQAYRKLATLRNPNQFAGWLHVIAKRYSIRWIRKKELVVQSLETASVDLVEKHSYERYLSEHQETEANERRYKIVNNLLKRLSKHERKVIMLYYLREMSVKEIGKILGVSVNTVKSQLQRARKRLQTFSLSLH